LYYYSSELEFARRIARRAGEIVLGYWKQGVKAESKADKSPVTIADKESERAIARALEETYPDDGILGEEGSAKKSRSGRQWIIDPIDGTRDFVRGNHAWAILIGLEDAGEVVAGVSYLPALSEMLVASRGAGAFSNDAPIRVSGVSDPSQAVLCLNGFNAISKFPFAPRLIGWMQQFWAVRSMGGCLDAMLIAKGQADLWIEPAGAAWDFAPLKIIAEEAGGRFFNFDGRASIYGRNCVVCTPGLEAMAREFIGC
jgi:histidinol phosphatase-like enzyme (inositol monophosphatase family)